MTRNRGPSSQQAIRSGALAANNAPTRDAWQTQVMLDISTTQIGSTLVQLKQVHHQYNSNRFSHSVLRLFIGSDV